jgi:1-aminocyclopropane-1-carboxylate deaminase/D-cysteine desulfhydrase-like pyridoxal-dependent ACC family enzyme
VISLGRYPTPVQRADGLCAAGSELWIKRDDRTNDVYGGNKVRKLEAILGRMLERGAKRVVTVGAVGSHHVLATAYFGRRSGLEVEAVLVPQPRTAHVMEVLRAGLGLGLRAFPVGSWSAAALAIARRVASGARFVQVGGSSADGSMAYVEAARELAAQVRRGELPEPDACVVALGSGGTAAGLAAGFGAEGMRTRVVGVCVSTPPWLLRVASLGLARACARRIREHGNDRAPGADLSRIRRRLTMDRRFLGRGYAYATAEGAEAIELARAHAGIALDPTYTAKAFASALWHVRARRYERVLYWHTLSSAPMAPLLEGAPTEERVDERLRALVGAEG